MCTPLPPRHEMTYTLPAIRNTELGSFLRPTHPLAASTFPPNYILLCLRVVGVQYIIYVDTICVQGTTLYPFIGCGWAGDETCRQENPQNSRLTIKYVIARDVVVEPRYLCVYFYCSYYIIYI